MPGLGGPERDAEGRGHVGQRQPEVVVQDDDRPLFGRQAPKRHVEQVAVGDGRRDVGDRRSVDRRQFDLDGPPARDAAGRRCRSGRRGSQPALEAIRIAERREVPPGPDESLLDRVSRELVVPEDQSGRRVQPRDEPAGQHGEGVMIASLRSLDELSLVHGPPSVCRRGDQVALDGIVGPVPQKVPSVLSGSTRWAPIRIATTSALVPP